MEEWKDIKGYEGLYQISSEGRIKSLERTWTSGRNNNITRHHIEMIIKCGNVKGYYQVALTKNGKTSQKKVHRLVAEAFIPNPDNLPIVNHKDENPSNNNVENLEWCTYKYNSTYGTARERAGAKISKSLTNNPKTSKKICQLTLDGEFVKIWESVGETGRRGFNSSSVGDCCRGYRRKSHKGFRWMYKEDYEKMLEDQASQQL